METIQYGMSQDVDFKNNEWTFKMSDGFKAAQGEFVIISLKEWNKILDEQYRAILQIK